MREIIGAGMAAIVLATASVASAADPQITVTGSGEVQVSPDMAVLDLGAQLRAETAAAVMAQTAETTQALLDALEAAGIAAADIQTRRAGLRPVFEQSQNGDAAPVPVAFEADSLLTVKVRDLSVLSGIYGAASEAGATRFDGLRFELSDPAEALAGARGAAVGDARLRAETYAQAAGLTLGSVLEIAEPGSNPRPMEFRSMAADMGAMPVAPGSLTVSAQITVVYALTE